MFNLPSFDKNHIQFRNFNEKSYVRILHASPDAPPVDIYINDELAIRNLSYKSFTEYVPLKSSVYNIKVFPTKTTSNPVINKNLFIPPESIFTIAASGLLKDIKLLPILDKEIDAKDPNKSYLRFIHLSPDAPAIDFYVDDKLIFRNIAFEDISNYIALNPSNYTVKLKVAGTDKTVLISPNMNLKPNKYYTVYAVGLVSSKPPLQILVPLDGNSYLNP